MKKSKTVPFHENAPFRIASEPPESKSGYDRSLKKDRYNRDKRSLWVLSSLITDPDQISL